MQATVLTFDPETRSGTVVLDDGATIPLPTEAFDDSELRLLRPGQRLTIETTTQDGEPSVSRILIVGIGADQTIR